jgi:hypothetical protein
MEKDGPQLRKVGANMLNKQSTRGGSPSYVFDGEY